MNELDTLLESSLKQLASDFQQREKRLSEQYTMCMDSYRECMTSFESQTRTLRQEQNSLSKRLDALTDVYKDNLKFMEKLSKQIEFLSAELRK